MKWFLSALSLAVLTGSLLMLGCTSVEKAEYEKRMKEYDDSGRVQRETWEQQKKERTIEVKEPGFLESVIDWIFGRIGEGAVFSPSPETVLQSLDGQLQAPGEFFTVTSGLRSGQRWLIYAPQGEDWTYPIQVGAKKSPRTVGPVGSIPDWEFPDGLSAFSVDARDGSPRFFGDQVTWLATPDVAQHFQYDVPGMEVVEAGDGSTLYTTTPDKLASWMWLNHVGSIEIPGFGSMKSEIWKIVDTSTGGTIGELPVAVVTDGDGVATVIPIAIK